MKKFYNVYKVCYKKFLFGYLSIVQFIKEKVSLYEKEKFSYGYCLCCMRIYHDWF